MIHTQKTRVPVDDNGKRKTKTMITRTTPGKETRSATIPSTRSRRTVHAQNVTIDHQSHTVSIKEDFLSKPLSETEILLKLSRKNPKYSPDVVNDLEEILRSPIKANRELHDDFGGSQATSSGSMRFTALSPAHDFYQIDEQNASRQLRLESDNDGDETESGTEREDRHPNQPSQSDSESEQAPDDDQSENEDHIRLPLHIKEEGHDDYELDLDQTSIIDGEFYTCEMCAAVFKDRAQLLLHVPIHI